MSNSKYLQENNVTALAFSKKNQYCAIATKNNHLVNVYKVNTFNNIDSWEILQSFKEHTQTIGDIDWSLDDKIITSSFDRSVFVWKKVSNVNWEKMLVNIDIKLSILSSKWAPSCKKIALGSSCSTLAIGYYNIQ